MRTPHASAPFRRAAAALALVLAAGATLAQEAGKTVLTVKAVHTVGMITYPAAVGDGITDDTLAIQGTIYYAQASAANRSGNGAVVFFPEGRYRITTTITVPNCGGLDFAGASASGYGYPIMGTFDPVYSSSIVGDFSDVNIPLIYSKAAWSRWSDLYLVGRLKKTSVTPTALYQTHSDDGFCISTVKFDGVYFVNSQDLSDIAGVGVSLGSNSGDFCNSEFNFHRCAFGKLTTGIKVNTDQGLDYVFDQVGGWSCKTFLDLAHGGNVSFNTGTFSGCGGDGAGDWIFKIGDGGPNNGTVKILNARFESGCKKLVRVDGEQNVLVENLLETLPGNASAAVEVGGGSVTISDSSFQSFPVLNFVTPTFGWLRSNVRFRDCKLPVIPATPPPPLPVAPPAGLITGVATGGYVYTNCTGIYVGATFYPFANATNVTGW